MPGALLLPSLVSLLLKYFPPFRAGHSDLSKVRWSSRCLAWSDCYQRVGRSRFQVSCEPNNISRRVEIRPAANSHLFSACPFSTVRENTIISKIATIFEILICICINGYIYMYIYIYIYIYATPGLRRVCTTPLSCYWITVGHDMVAFMINSSTRALYNSQPVPSVIISAEQIWRHAHLMSLLYKSCLVLQSWSTKILH